MPQYRHLGRAFTSVVETRGRVANNPEKHMLYHNRHVVCWNAHMICLRNNGYFTFTTKVRMNQASNQYSLGYQVFQRTLNGQRKWYVKYRGSILDFDNGLILYREHAQTRLYSRAYATATSQSR